VKLTLENLPETVVTGQSGAQWTILFFISFVLIMISP